MAGDILTSAFYQLVTLATRLVKRFGSLASLFASHTHAMEIDEVNEEEKNVVEVVTDKDPRGRKVACYANTLRANNNNSEHEVTEKCFSRSAQSLLFR